MGPFEAQVLSTVLGVGGAVIALALVLRFKLRSKEIEAKGADSELGPVVDALRDEVGETRAQLLKVHERLDFAERLLTDGRSRGPVDVK